ncbi:hypothetical protein HDU76_009996 [Blyttiomyces sp. JEL0837]|nr:hypothetical protein HDU76_009996 [Blyttiomyces sp. JEL0837]
MTLQAELLVPVELTSIQRELYKAILSRNYQLLRSLGVSGNQEQQRVQSLHNILMELRKVCDHPYLSNHVVEEQLTTEEAHRRRIMACGKLILLQPMLKALKQAGHRVLIFSQFKMLLDELEPFLEGEGHQFLRIDGETPSDERQGLIEEFNSNTEIFVFLLTTRTGGTGINLTAADTIIIYDADWNPHQDMQAMARVHRIGQTRSVAIYKLFTRDTVEERILEIAKRKLILDHLVVDHMDVGKIDKEEMSAIIKFGAQKLFSEKDDVGQQSIRYDDAAIHRLVDRETVMKEAAEKQRMAEVENEASGSEERRAALSFSFAKVWTVTDDDKLAEKSASLEELPALAAPAETRNDEFWDTLLKDRVQKAAQAASIGQVLGKRARKVVNYDESRKRPSTVEDTDTDGKASKMKKQKDDDFVDEGEEDDDIESDDFMTDVAPRGSKHMAKSLPNPALPTMASNPLSNPVMDSAAEPTYSRTDSMTDVMKAMPPSATFGHPPPNPTSGRKKNRTIKAVPRALKEVVVPEPESQHSMAAARGDVMKHPVYRPHAYQPSWQTDEAAQFGRNSMTSFAAPRHDGKGWSHHRPRYDVDPRGSMNTPNPCAFCGDPSCMSTHNCPVTNDPVRLNEFIARRRSKCQAEGRDLGSDNSLRIAERIAAKYNARLNVMTARPKSTELTAESCLPGRRISPNPPLAQSHQYGPASTSANPNGSYGPKVPSGGAFSSIRPSTMQRPADAGPFKPSSGSNFARQPPMQQSSYSMRSSPASKRTFAVDMGGSSTVTQQQPRGLVSGPGAYKSSKPSTIRPLHTGGTALSSFSDHPVPPAKTHSTASTLSPVKIEYDELDNRVYPPSQVIRAHRPAGMATGMVQHGVQREIRLPTGTPPVTILSVQQQVKTRDSPTLPTETGLRGSGRRLSNDGLERPSTAHYGEKIYLQAPPQQHTQGQESRKNPTSQGYSQPQKPRTLYPKGVPPMPTSTGKNHSRQSQEPHVDQSANMQASVRTTRQPSAAGMATCVIPSGLPGPRGNVTAGSTLTVPPTGHTSVTRPDTHCYYCGEPIKGRFSLEHRSRTLQPPSHLSESCQSMINDVDLAQSVLQKFLEAGLLETDRYNDLWRFAEQSKADEIVTKALTKG